MKTFTVELQSYPQEFIVSAETKEEAIIKATERFGRSVYESNVIEESMCEKCHERPVIRNGYCSRCHQEIFNA